MPGYDRTGPEGQGSQTGRRLGKCNPNKKNANTSDSTDDIREKAGRGRGLGLGKRLRIGRAQGPGNDEGKRKGSKRGRGNS